jgi:hypothetical protein
VLSFKRVFAEGTGNLDFNFALFFVRGTVVYFFKYGSETEDLKITANAQAVTGTQNVWSRSRVMLQVFHKQAL